MRAIYRSLEGLPSDFGHGQPVWPARISITSRIPMIFSGRKPESPERSALPKLGIKTGSFPASLGPVKALPQVPCLNSGKLLDPIQYFSPHTKIQRTWARNYMAGHTHVSTVNSPRVISSVRGEIIVFNSMFRMGICGYNHWGMSICFPL